jgi:hypothetical protein
MFITNSGSFATNPFNPVNDRYLQLAHPAVADVLMLQSMPDDGKGYSIPLLQGLMSSSGRAQGGSLIAIKGSYNKLEWKDLAFVVTMQQLSLFDVLLQAQTGAVPVTVVDNVLLSYMTKSVLVIPADQYRSAYAGIQLALIQFTLSEA